MSGCYGSSPEDRYFEGLLFKYLAEGETPEDERPYEDDEDYDSDPSFPPFEQDEEV